MEFAEILQLSGLTQKEFAERYHIKYETVNRWVNGGKQPPYVLALLERFVREDAVGEKMPWVYGVGIKRIIDISGLTQKEFAERYGISYGVIRSWVSKNGNVNVYILYLLERAVREDVRKG